MYIGMYGLTSITLAIMEGKNIIAYPFIQKQLKCMTPYELLQGRG